MSVQFPTYVKKSTGRADSPSESANHTSILSGATMQGTKLTRKPKATNQIWRSIAGLTILMSASLYGQTITGIWQGTLPIAENPRIVLEITKSADGSLRGGYKQIDRSADDRPLSSVTFQATQLDFTQAFANVGYRGNLSEDGKSIKGSWTENSHTYPLTFVLTTKETLWKYEGGTVLAPMSATADPAFEVATRAATASLRRPIVDP
jgi:hypothetical protein